VVVHETIVMIVMMSGPHGLVAATAFGMVRAGRRAARPVVTVNQAIVVEFGGRG